MASLLGTLLRKLNPPSYSLMLHRTYFYLKPTAQNMGFGVNPHQILPNSLSLRPQLPLVSQVSGFKIKYKLKKRCKDCYMVVRNEQTFVICPTHPRHKQMTPVKKLKYVWQIAQASQSKIRPW